MKKYIGIGILLIVVGLISGCTSSQPVVVEGERDEGTVGVESDKDFDRVMEIQDPHRLSDFLERVPGVRFVGGEVSIRGNPPPLFIIDGAYIGNSYTQAERLVNVNDIQSVEVLKNPGELGMYGWRGRHGVIIIRTM